MKRFIQVTFLSFIIIYSGFSQQKENTGTKILFHGLVMDAGTLAPVSNSQISINRYFSSITGADGTFAFYVNRNDTVVFKSLGYKSATLLINDTLSGNEFIAGIYLSSDTLSAGEVVIVPRFTNLKSDILNSRSKTPSTMANARYNVAIGAYQGKTGRSNLNDPASNYELLRQRQKTDAFERGGIPSDKILGLSPLMLIPAAYLLLHGLPEKQSPLKPDLTNYELDQLQKKYLESLRKKK